MSFQLRMLRWKMGLLSVIWPSLAARKAFQLFQNVRFKSVRKREMDFYNENKREVVPSSSEDIFCYRGGDPNGPTIVLVHGWDSNAGSMSQCFRTLSGLGFNVLSFDLPGHAFYKKTYTNLPESAAALKTVIDHLGPLKSVSFVAHSFGSAVTAWYLAESGFQADKLIFLTGPNRIENVFLQFKQAIHLGDKAHKKMISLTEDILKKPLSEVSIESHLKKSTFRKLILVHDHNDRVLPYSNSVEIKTAIPEAELVTLENTGHYRMLWNVQVIRVIAQKIGSV